MTLTYKTGAGRGSSCRREWAGTCTHTAHHPRASHSSRASQEQSQAPPPLGLFLPTLLPLLLLLLQIVQPSFPLLHPTDADGGVCQTFSSPPTSLLPHKEHQNATFNQLFEAETMPLQTFLVPYKSGWSKATVIAAACPAAAAAVVVITSPPLTATACRQAAPPYRLCIPHIMCSIIRQRKLPFFLRC